MRHHSRLTARAAPRSGERLVRAGLSAGVRAAASRLVKAEALLRLRQADGDLSGRFRLHPARRELGADSPARRLGVANRAANRPRHGSPQATDLKIAVNVSPAQLRSSEFPRLLTRLLERERLAPQALELELTESVFLDGSKAQIRETLQQIAAMGVTLAIDDFGTGYSSLAYLRDFPFDEIKIDGSFVADIGERPGRRRHRGRGHRPRPQPAASASPPRASRPTSSWSSCASGAAMPSRAICSRGPSPPTACSGCTRPWRDGAPLPRLNRHRPRLPR